MKISHFLSVITLSSVILVSCKNDVKENTEKTAATTEQTQDQPTQLATATFTVEGMHCQVGCAGHLEKKLAKLDGVQKAEIDFEAKKATVEYDVNKITPEIFVQTVEGAADGKTYKVSDLRNSKDHAMFVSK